MIIGEIKNTEFIIFDYCQNLDGYDAKVYDSVKLQAFKRRLDFAALIDRHHRENESLSRLATLD